jgi:hypothetical protein
MNPEFLAGLCGLRCLPTKRLPSQGPAPLSTWGFSLASRFCVAPESNSESIGRHTVVRSFKWVGPYQVAAKSRTPCPDVTGKNGLDEWGQAGRNTKPISDRITSVTVGLNGQFRERHRPSTDSSDLNERARRGPAWDGQPTYQGTKRKSVIFGAVGAYCGGVNGPLKPPAFDSFIQVSGSEETGTAGGSRNPCFGRTMSERKA